MAIILYSQRQIGLIREASKVVAECHQIARELCRPGNTTRMIDAAIARHIRKCGGSSPFLGYELPGKIPFPSTICASVNDVVVHGFGDDLPLQEGDLVSIDVGVRRNGYIGDSGWTYPVGKVDAQAARLLQVGEEALIVGLRAMTPKGMLGDVCQTIQRHVEAQGFSVVRDFVGHGVGQSLHEEPQVPNYVDESIRETLFNTILKPGMVLAVEPMVNEGASAVVFEEHNWPVRTADGKRSVHFEHTIAIHKDQIEVLTLKPGDAAW